MSQVLELNEKLFCETCNPDISILNDILPLNRTKISRYFGSFYNSHKYRQIQTYDNLIKFLDHEYEKIATTILKQEIVDQISDQDEIKISDNELTIVITDHIPSINV